MALPLACAGVAIALSGCSSGPGGRAAAPALTPPPVGAVQAPASGREGMLQLPLSAYGSGDGVGPTRVLAIRALTARCMHDAGYALFTREDAIDEGAGAPVNASALPAGAFGYLPESVAAGQGFHAARSVAPGRARRPLSGAEDQAAQECVKNAFPQVEVADQGGAELVAKLFGESVAALEKDERVAAATRAWRDCMGAAGFAGVSPSGLVEQYRRSAAATAEPTAQELAAARADAACTTSTNLAGIWFAVLAGYQRQQIAANQERLAAYQQTFKDYAAKMAGIIAGS
ncbi:hypothetical protein [Kitasatospora sp. NPDC050543]|uniref:hypothetical protein n=1 Tax=Kitasatospora sp. NPDC050543 TaxID=3364054 RepID=UPI00378B8D3D